MIDHSYRTEVIEIIYILMPRSFLHRVKEIDFLSRYCMGLGYINGIIDTLNSLIFTKEAKAKYSRMNIIYSDQGSELSSQKYMETIHNKAIKVLWAGKTVKSTIFSLNAFGRA